MQQSAGLGRIQTHGHKYSRMENQLKVLEITSSVVHFFISVVILELLLVLVVTAPEKGSTVNKR